MIERLVAVLGVLFLCSQSFRFNVRSFGLHLPTAAMRPMEISAKPSIGQTVVAEVDDIGGSLKDPIVFFKVWSMPTLHQFTSKKPYFANNNFYLFRLKVMKAFC
jgi:hypothetical protein